MENDKTCEEGGCIVSEKKRKVLVVDDDPQVLRGLKRMLFDLPYELDAVDNVNDALVQIKEVVYDAILLDYAMPERTGLDFVREAEWDKERTKIILITGYLSNALASEFFSYGISGYLGKPFRQEDLIGMLSCHLNPPCTE